MAKKTIQHDSEYKFLDDFFRNMGYTGGKITSSNPHYLTDCSSLERTEYRIQRLNFNGCCGEDTDARKREKGKRLEICQAYYEKPGLIVEWGKNWPISPEEKDLDNKWIFVGFIKKTYWKFWGYMSMLIGIHYLQNNKG